VRVEIRPYADTDEESVVALWSQVFDDMPAWNHPQTDIKHKLKVQPQLFVVATIERDLAGTAMAGFDGHRGWVYYLAVSPRHRRQGIGTLLMRRVERDLVHVDCPKLNLQVRARSEQAVKFYQSMGYTIEERVSMGKLLVHD